MTSSIYELARSAIVGYPADPNKQPSPSGVLAAFRKISDAIDAGLSNGGLVYDTKAHMDADLAHDYPVSAWVIGDPTIANNGIYQKQGASGSGSWTRLQDLPYSFIKAENAGAGTANAIQATTSVPIPAGDGAAEIILNITANNSGAATVSFNGGSALTIKTASGADVQADYLVAGAVVSGFVVASKFQLTSEVGTAAAAAAAQAAADAAVAAASTVVSTQSSRAYAMASYHPEVAPGFIQTAGHVSAGDGGGALFKKVAVEPSHEGKLSITLGDGTTVVWFEIAEDTIPVKALGAKGDTIDVAVTASITSGTKSLTAAGASFTADDVGKLISIPGAGAAGSFLGSTIAAVTDSTHVTLADNAGTTLSAVSATITYGTDDTEALTSALKVASGRSAFFAPGVYSITKAALAYSQSAVRGVYGASIIKPATKYTGSETYDGACIRNSTFGSASDYDETDILVEDMGFDFACRGVGVGGQQVGVFLRFVDRPKVQRCLQWSGGDLSGMLQCRNSQVSGNVAWDIRNCAYDHWDGTGYAIVSNNIARSDSVTSHQVIQFNTNTDDIGSDPATQNMEKIIIEGNLIDVPGDGTSTGIAVGCLHAGGAGADIVIANNYVRGQDFDILIQGNIDGFSITGNVLRDLKYRGIFITRQPSETGIYPVNGVVSDNLISGGQTGSESISVAYGSDILIADNKISAPGAWGIHMYADSSNCVVQDNMVAAGTGGDILDGGTGNKIVKPGVYGRYASVSVYSAAAPSSFTDLDLSSVTGAYRCLVLLRVRNQSTTDAKYVFRANGDTTTEASLSAIGTGANVCQMSNNDSQYVSVVTDAAGVVQWASDVTSGSTTVVVVSYQRLQ